MRILIIKINQLGDNLVYLPVLQALLDRFGADTIDLFTSPTASGLFEGLLPPSRIHVHDRDEFNRAWKNPVRMAAIIREVRKVRPDLVLVPYDQGNVARIAARLSGARHRIGVANPGLRTNWCLNRCLNPDLASPMAEQDWMVMREVSRVLGDDENGFPDTPPAPDLEHLLPADGRKSPRRALIHGGASREYKRWPLARFVELGNRLADAGFEVAWCSQEEDAEKELSPRIDILPQGSLRDFIVATARCGVFVGNNSGPMNIANALGLPCVIFSGPSPEKWDPFWHREQNLNLRDAELPCQPCDPVTGPVGSCQNTAEPMACMNRWSVDSVFAKVKAMLEGKPGSGPNS